MPESKSRHPHHSHQQHHRAPHNSKPKTFSRTVMVAMVFFSLLGLGISFFVTGNNVFGVATGVIVGAVAGYLFGHQMDKTFRKK